MVKYVKGDVLESGADIIAHGCNCVGGFGSGVAGQIVKRYPLARDFYLHKFEHEGWKLGEVQFVTVEKVRAQRYIANCATQQEYYPRNKVHADYQAIRVCMQKVKEFAQNNDLSVALPKIGAGLAGGDWNVIELILQEVFHDYSAVVYVLE